MKTGVGINRFGRIVRSKLEARIQPRKNDMNAMAVNDLGDTRTNAHLLKRDSVCGQYAGEVKINYILQVPKMKILSGGELKVKSINCHITICYGPQNITSDHYTMDNSQFLNQPPENVLIVHGRNIGAKETVARFVEHLSLRPVILGEQPNQGLTVIEKLERFSNAAYCIVLLTPDDIGYEVGLPEGSNPRARQNVVFEWGYFISQLRRRHVCALYWEDVEIPSDTSGLVYIKYDKEGAWRLLLAKELKSAGLPIDLNQAIQ